MNALVITLLALNAFWLIVALIVKPTVSLRVHKLLNGQSGSVALFLFTVLVVSSTIASI